MICPRCKLEPCACRWVAWRRKANTHGDFTRLPYTEAATRAETLRLAMDLELVEGDLDWEYQVMPVGEFPKRNPDRQSFRDRMMRPRHG